MNILVAVDLSEVSQKILHEAKMLGAGLSAKLWLLHVAAPKPGFAGYTGGYVDYGSGFVDYYGPDPKTLRKQIAQNLHEEHKVLQKEADQLRAEGINATALLIQGKVIDVVLQEAAKLAADMIIMGSHGHGAVYTMLMGSVSEGVLKHAPCPVLLIPTRDRNAKTSPSEKKSEKK